MTTKSKKKQIAKSDVDAPVPVWAIINPTAQAVLTIRDFEKSSFDLCDFAEELATQVAAVNNGDLSRAEEILITQAHTLNTLFNNLARRASKQEYLPQYETQMRLALKAQSQCRATLETLANIKNPPIVYARQANVTTGPQQINNGTAAPSRTREIENEQTQLSGGNHELLPDTRASGHESRIDPALETMGKIHRAKNRSG